MRIPSMEELLAMPAESSAESSPASSLGSDRVPRVRALCAGVLVRVAVAAAALVVIAGATLPAPPARADEAWGPLVLLERTIKPGERHKFSYQHTRTFEGAFLDTSVFAIRGRRPGPTLCLTALVHGDERNGFEIVRMIFKQTDPNDVSGTLIALPAVNVNGFRTGSRYMPDRRDLNRAFPGGWKGSNTSVVAKLVFDLLKANCDVLVDLHTGSFDRANMPQIRVDLANPKAKDLALRFGAPVIVGGAGPLGSLRREMMEAGIPAIIYEAGLPLRFEPHEIGPGVQGVKNVMIGLGLVAGKASAPTPADRVFSSSRWLRVPLQQGGVFYPDKALGTKVAKGDVVAHIEDPFTDESYTVLADASATVIGMAVPQIVFSGYALIHVAEP